MAMLNNQMVCVYIYIYIKYIKYMAKNGRLRIKEFWSTAIYLYIYIYTVIFTYIFTYIYIFEFLYVVVKPTY